MLSLPIVRLLHSAFFAVGGSFVLQGSVILLLLVLVYVQHAMLYLCWLAAPQLLACFETQGLWPACWVGVAVGVQSASLYSHYPCWHSAFKALPPSAQCTVVHVWAEMHTLGL